MKLQFHHHLEQLQSENISRELPVMCKWTCEHNLLPRGELSIFVLWSQDNQNTTQVLPVSGLVQPPKLSPECGEMLCSANSGASLYVLRSQGTLFCQPKPWPCMHLPPSEFNTQLHLLQQLMGSLGREGHFGDSVRYYKFTLNSIIYLTASTDSCEYRLCARN